ncbi:MAG TPA: fasciclin domain-containing protein [Saprospiraceae bacterium]|nr:fasciclin domain-containing protein [Saprospiraceae bacterium]
MKLNFLFPLACSLICLMGLSQCSGNTPAATTTSETAAADGGQSSVQDNDSQKDIVKVAVGSKDHTTLVTAVKAAELVDVLSNAGPFTVFAPTNAAFDKLPAGTVEGLLKPDKKDALADILQYHVAVAVYKPEMFTDGQIVSMANGGSVTIGVKDGKITVNGANVVATVQASNGIIHVIDNVLLPK